MKMLISGPLFRDYGMVVVLLLLAGFFSLLTTKDQFPTGKEAGKQVAKRIIAEQSPGANVLIIVRDTEADRALATTAIEELGKAGIRVLQVITGGPADARKAIEALIEQGIEIDAIAANDVTAKWNIYDRFSEVGSRKCVVPQPYRWPDFLKATNLIGVANQTSIYAIIAIGMTMVIITGGIDLSVGSLVALSAVTAALFLRNYAGGRDATSVMVIVAISLALLNSAMAGLVTGRLITRYQLPPFIATLGMMMIASGLAFRLSKGSSIPELPASFFVLGRSTIYGIPCPVLIMVFAYIIADLIMSRTVFGRYVYAIGGNVQAAYLSGIPVKRTLLTVYVASATLAGFGGILLASQLAAGDPKYGVMYELEVIAAVVVGGTSLMGGRGKIFGTLIGAFIIAVIRNGMNLTDVDPFNQKIVLGTVLIGAVAIDMLKRKHSS